MKRQYIWKSILIGSLAISLTACGNSESPNNQNGDTNNPSETNQQQNAGNEIMADELESTLQLHGTLDNNIVFLYSLNNTTEKELTLTFHSGQKYDYILRDEDGNKMMKFSDDKAFTEAIEYATLTPGEEINYELKVPSLDPGKYELEVWLTATTKETFKETINFEVLENGDIRTENGRSTRDDLELGIEFGTWQEATYVGQADPHTVEFILEDHAISFQVSDTLKERVTELNEGETVHIKAVVNNQTMQVELIDITKEISEKPDTPIEATIVHGDFVGMADPHTIEVIIEDQPEQFQVPDQLREKVKNFNEGDQVSLTLKVDERTENYLLKNISKITNLEK